MARKKKTAPSLESMLARPTVGDARTRLRSARLIYSSNDLNPDARLFSGELLEPSVTVELQRAHRHSAWTTFPAIFTAAVPSETKSSRSKSGDDDDMWRVDGTFFVVIDHTEDCENEDIRRYIKEVAVPLLAVRFMSLVEYFATMGGIKVQAIASVGLRVEAQDIEIVSST